MLEKIVNNSDRGRREGEYLREGRLSLFYREIDFSFFLKRSGWFYRKLVGLKKHLNEFFGYFPFCFPDLESPPVYKEPSELGSGYEIVCYGGRNYLFGHDREGITYFLGKVRGGSFRVGNKRAVFLRDVLSFSVRELNKLPELFKKYLPNLSYS